MVSMSLAKEKLKQFYGFDDFRESQKDVIEQFLINDNDVLAVMPTGGGKSICYQIPALVRNGVCIVLSPIISLMYDQVTTLRKKGIKADFINSNMTKEEQYLVLQRMINGETKFVYASPERLKNYDFREALKRTNISLFAIDEAHCISQWGHEFRPEYAKIHLMIASIEKGRKIPKIALTATATPEVIEEIKELSGLREPKVIVKGFERENLSFHVHHPSSKKDMLITLLNNQKDKGGVSIIYCSSRKSAMNSTKFLKERNINVGQYHAGLSKIDRENSQNNFIEDKYDVLVATNAFGMGVDKPNVRLVIHYDMPDSMEAYYQEAGRAGRDGKYAECHLMYSPHDRRLHEFLMDASIPPKNVLNQVKNIIDEWPSDIFNPTTESLRTVIPAFKESMLNSIYRILEDEKIIKVTQMSDVNGDIFSAAEIINRNLDISKRFEDIRNRRIIKMRFLEVMERYCEGNICLRNFMLNYFGEHRKEPCGKCSTCIKHYQSLENKNNYSKQAKICLETVLNSSFKMTKETLTKIMFGVPDISTLSVNAHLLKDFGALSYMGENKVQEFIDYLIEEQYFIYNGEIDEMLYISLKGKKVLKDERSIYIEKGLFKTKGKKQKENKTQAIAKLQEDLSKEYQVAKFAIWTPVTAKDLLIVEPKSIEDLSNIKGLNQYKIDNFGEKIIEIFNR